MKRDHAGVSPQTARGHDYERQYVFHVRQSGQSGATDVGPWLWVRSGVERRRASGGMLTDRDICMAAFFQGVPITGIKVSAVMSRQLFGCTSDDDLSAVETIMRQKKVRRLPVLNQDGRLVGLVSLSDIARRADEEYARGAVNRYVADTEVARLAADISKRRRA